MMITSKSTLRPISLPLPSSSFPKSLLTLQPSTLIMTNGGGYGNIIHPSTLVPKSISQPSLSLSKPIKIVTTSLNNDDGYDDDHKNLVDNQKAPIVSIYLQNSINQSNESKKHLCPKKIIHHILFTCHSISISIFYLWKKTTMIK